MTVILGVGYFIMGLFLLLWILFVCVVLPIWTLIHCAVSSLSAGAKTFWILFMLLTGPIGSLAYGFFASKKRFFQWNAVLSVILCVVLLVGAINIVSFIFKEAENLRARVALKVTRLNMSEITAEDQNNLRSSLEVLQNEATAEKKWMSKLDRLSLTMNFYTLLDIYAEDGQLTDSEYRDWMDKYNTRALINKDALTKYIRELETKNHKTNTTK